MTFTCFFFLKTGVIRNSLSNLYKAKQRLERLNFETLYFYKQTKLRGALWKGLFMRLQNGLEQCRPAIDQLSLCQNTSHIQKSFTIERMSEI